MRPTSRRAALLSALLPGLGQFYNREWAKGAAFLVAMVIADAAFNVTADTLRLLQSLFSSSVEASTELPSLSSVMLRSVPVFVIVIWSVADAARTTARRESPR